MSFWWLTSRKKNEINKVTSTSKAMGNIIFGRAKGGRHHKITPHDQAVLDLKVQRDKLTQYQKKLEIICNKETSIAKSHISKGNKRLALIALKKRKYQEQLLAQTERNLLNLETLVSEIEYKQVEQDVVKGLQAGNQVLKEIQQELNIESVEKLMDETAEAIAYQKEVEELISGRLTDEDEADVLKELQELESASLDEQALKLPKVPQDHIAVENKLSQLEALPQVQGKEPQEAQRGESSMKVKVAEES